MLDAWVIEKLKREEQRRREQEERDRPRVYVEDEPYTPPAKKQDEPKRGVVVVQVWG